MRIGIDARMYDEGLGIGRYIAKLIAHLERMDSADTYIIFLTRKNWDSYHPGHERFVKKCVNIRWYSPSEQFLLPLILLWHRLDCMHFPHMNVPIAYPGAFVMTIHDLILLKHPLSATSASSTRHPLIHTIKHWCYRIILRIALRRARHIITISQSVKNDLVGLCSVASERISVIYEAADPLPAQESCARLSRFSNTQFFFRAGNAYPHKNLEGLLRAFQRVRRTAPHGVLLLCGQEDYFQKKVLSRINKLGLSDAVVHLGSVSDACLAWLYAHAIAYVFPSFEEGFGLPAVEAFLHGCPVLASDIPSLREVCGDAALYFNPYDSDDIAKAMESLLNKPSTRHQLIARGSRRAQSFSWERLARETAGVYARYTAPL